MFTTAANSRTYFASGNLTSGLEMRLKMELGNLLPWSSANGIRVYVHNQSDLVLTESVGYIASLGSENNYAVRYVSDSG